MPRIDPIQLLKCLSVLLSPSGGIKSRDEVQRLASLMTKFSKKLVSKCIYIQILKCTETELLGLFMGSGGWRLVHMWLTESIVAKNWPLVRELLELLLLCPVDIDRLKTNNCPKLVKELSKDGNHFAIRALASKLVEQWLKTVKGENVIPLHKSDLSQIMLDTNSHLKLEVKLLNEDRPDSLLSVEGPVVKTKSEQLKSVTEIKLEKRPDELTNGEIKNETAKDSDPLPILKINLKDGQILTHVEESENKKEESKVKSSKSKSKSKEKVGNSSDEKSKSKHTSKSHSSSSYDKHKSRHKSSSPSKERTKEKSKHSSHSSRSKSNESSKSNDSSRRSSDSSSSSKSRSYKHKEDSSSKNKVKEKEDKIEKNKALNSKTQENEKPVQNSIHKLGKIPKLSDIKRDKPSISIEIRKPDEPKPKTVKTFHSKFRKHGLEEEIKPPPSRAVILSKKSNIPPSTISLPKRPSPPAHTDTPPEKKLKTIEPIDKPGAIKLIPAKPKPLMLLESDLFMDALNASTSNKKEPKKRKRRTSGSKDGNTPNDSSSPPHTPTNTSPTQENKSVPLRFYQDTLDSEVEKEQNLEKPADDDKEKIDSEVEKKNMDTEEEKVEVQEPVTLTVNGLRGVLCYHKKKGPKKSIKWKADLEEIQYFEFDETERVNVTKSFTDMKYLDRIHERESFEKARNLINDDVMEEKTIWKPLILVDCDCQTVVEYGKNSKERDIQDIRQKGTLQPLYFHKSMIPDSPLEADIETHPYNEPCNIPLEDITGNQDNISDYRNMPWPEPKGNAPPVTSTNVNIPPMFQTPISQFPNGFQNTPFGMPNFQGSNMIPGDWPNGMPPHMMGPTMGPNGPVMSGPMPPGVMAPGLMMPPENMMMGPDMFNVPAMFPSMPPENFNMMESMNMPQNMFPPDFNRAPGLPPQENQNFRGAMRGRGGQWRNKGNWEGPPRGRGGISRGSRKTVCIYFQRKGSCRQGENCSFLHPGVNGPY